MEFPIIDVSKQSVSEFATEYSKAKAVRSVVWYRFLRPTFVLATWALAAIYIRWCVENATDDERSLDAFMPGIEGIGIVVLAMIFWTFGRQMDALNPQRVRRVPDMLNAPHSDTTHDIPAGDAGRCLVAYHDEAGMISHVTTIHEFERQAA